MPSTHNWRRPARKLGLGVRPACPVVTAQRDHADFGPQRAGVCNTSKAPLMLGARSASRAATRPRGIVARSGVGLLVALAGHCAGQPRLPCGGRARRPWSRSVRAVAPARTASRHWRATDGCNRAKPGCRASRTALVAWKAVPPLKNTACGMGAMSHWREYHILRGPLRLERAGLRGIALAARRDRPDLLDLAAFHHRHALAAEIDLQHQRDRRRRRRQRHILGDR